MSPMPHIPLESKADEQQTNKFWFPLEQPSGTVKPRSLPPPPAINKKKLAKALVQGSPAQASGSGTPAGLGLATDFQSVLGVSTMCTRSLHSCRNFNMIKTKHMSGS